MNKKISLVLCFAILISCLTACGVKKPVIEPEKPLEVKEEPSVVSTVSYKTVEDMTEKNLNVEIIKEKDEIGEKLEECGYKISEGYTLFPTESHNIIHYLMLDDELVLVYLNKKGITYSYTLHDDSYYDSNSLPMIYNSTKGDMYTAYKTSPLEGIIGGISDALSGSSTNMATSDALFEPSWSESEEVLIEDNFNTSEYKDVKETSYLNVKNSPLSTFAADVDTASYTNFRSVLIDEAIAYSIYDKDEYNSYNEDLHDIRIEEMLNYFDYSYSQGNDDIFEVNTEISDTPWNKDTKLMAVNVKAKDLSVEENKGSNLVFLIDTSGSMDDTKKLPLLKQSLTLLVDNLTEKDTISIVTYSGDERVVAEGLNGTEKEKLKNAINELVPYGSTNGEGGIKKAYEIAEKYKDGHSNSRIIMCSDGDLNVGLHSEDDLIDLVEKKRKTGVYLSVLGFGLGNYKDNKMEALADNGNGNYHYIDSIKEGKKVLVDDMLSTLVTIADDVKFQIEFNPKYIKGYRKIGYENRDMADEDFHDDTKDGGEVGFGHEVTIVYEIVAVDSEMKIGGSDLKYQEETSVTNDSTDWMTVSVRYKNHGEKESVLKEYIINEGCYTETPSNDWRFISNLIGFGLVVNDSDYKGDLDIDKVIDGIRSCDLSELDRQELYSLTMLYKQVSELQK